MLLGGIQLSLGILTLNPDVFLLSGWQRCSVTAHPVLALGSTLPACSRPNKRFFPLPPPQTCEQLSPSPLPRAASLFHTGRAGKPLKPTSTGNSQVCQTLSLHCWTGSWYLVAFLSGFFASVFPRDRRFNQDDPLSLPRPYEHVRPRGCLDDLGEV